MPGPAKVEDNNNLEKKENEVVKDPNT